MVHSKLILVIFVHARSKGSVSSAGVHDQSARLSFSAAHGGSVAGDASGPSSAPASSSKPLAAATQGVPTSFPTIHSITQKTTPTKNGGNGNGNEPIVQKPMAAPVPPQISGSSRVRQVPAEWVQVQQKFSLSDDGIKAARAAYNSDGSKVVSEGSRVRTLPPMSWIEDYLRRTANTVAYGTTQYPTEAGYWSAVGFDDKMSAQLGGIEIFSCGLIARSERSRRVEIWPSIYASPAEFTTARRWGMMSSWVRTVTKGGRHERRRLSHTVSATETGTGTAAVRAI